MTYDLARSANRVVTFLALGALLTACTATQQMTPEPDFNAWSARKAAISGVNDWRLNARAGLSVGEQGYNGTLTWQQVYDDIDFRVRGPFGLGGLHINGDKESLRVRTSTGELFYVEDIQRDMRAQLGWSLPIHSMRHWVLGVPDPSLPAEETVDGAGRLSGLTQGGWFVRYDSYEDYGGWDLPRKIKFEGENVRIRLVIDDWSISLAGANP